MPIYFYAYSEMEFSFLQVDTYKLEGQEKNTKSVSLRNIIKHR